MQRRPCDHGSSARPATRLRPAAEAGAAQPAGTVALRPGGRPAQPQPALPHPDAASVEQQLARLAFEPFVDLDARGRPRAGAARRDPDPGQRRPLRRRANDPLPSAARRALERRRRGHRRATCSSRCARSSIRATRCASREGYDLIDRAARARRAHGASSTCGARGRRRSRRVLLRYRAAVRAAGARSARRRRRWRAPPSTRRRPSATARIAFVSWRRGEGLRYRGQPAATGAGRPRVARLDVRIVPDPATNLTAAARGRTRLEPVAPAQIARSCAATRASRSCTCRPRSSPASRSTRRASAARRRARAARRSRCRSTATRSARRSRSASIR